MSLKKLKLRYFLNKNADIGQVIKCPSCDATFIKEHYQQAFCKTKGKSICKDKYWNTVTPDKKNNRTRLSKKRKEFLKKIGINLHK